MLNAARIDSFTSAAQSCHDRLDQLLLGMSTRQMHQFFDQLEYNSHCSTTDSQPHPDLLSERELQVLVLLANGYTRREIGSSLDISANTAAKHIFNIYRKLDISSVAEATRFAIRHQLLS